MSTHEIETVGFEIPNSPLRGELTIHRGGKKPRIDLNVSGFANPHFLNSTYSGPETEDPRYKDAAKDFINVAKRLMEKSPHLRPNKETRLPEINVSKPGVDLLTVTAHYPEAGDLLHRDKGNANALFSELQEQLRGFIDQGGFQETLKRNANANVPDPHENTPEGKEFAASIKQSQENDKEKAQLYASFKKLRPEVPDESAKALASFAHQYIAGERQNNAARIKSQKAKEKEYQRN